MKLCTIIAAFFLLFSVGCVGFVEWEIDDDIDCPEKEVVHVNTYVKAPVAVLKLIESSVKGYCSPNLSRYNRYLYPPEIKGDIYNLPCYVRTDYNGDGVNDYAFLFSKEEWSASRWYVTTKLLVVLSIPSGYSLSCDMVLGTTTADAATPVEEYWSIRYIPDGYHQLVTVVNGVTQTKTIFLKDDGFFLASIDPNEESIFYAQRDIVYEIDWSGTYSTAGRTARIKASRVASLGTATIQKDTIQFPKFFDESRKPLVQIP
ncbi:MAG: hypothetical protein JW795_02060 [Chitinivibrionales bacterium]|nr:hypothetical protein [Chitinivibrionales bacterium]